MRLFKKISCLAFLAFSLIHLAPNQVIAQGLADPEPGCYITVMGEKILCTRVWCSSTMSMSGCNTGGAVGSQTCNTASYC